MKTVIVYYSMSGNCEYTAKKIARALDADLVRIEPQQTYPDSGAKKFLWGGMKAVMGDAPALKPYKFKAPAYDRVIFGFPVWASNPTPPIRSFIKENSERLKGKKFSAFACEGGSGGEKALAKLKKMLGTESLEAEMILIDPKDKPDPLNDEKISVFCEKLA